MKQITECLDRFFEGKRPLKKKWSAISSNVNGSILYLYHYCHLILVYDIKKREITFEWWEKPADKRGLDAAKKYLEKKLR